MNGPHGMYVMNLQPHTPRNIHLPLEVVESLRDGFEAEGGIRTVFLTVVDQADEKGERGDGGSEWESSRHGTGISKCSVDFLCWCGKYPLKAYFVLFHFFNISF